MFYDSRWLSLLFFTWAVFLFTEHGRILSHPFIFFGLLFLTIIFFITYILKTKTNNLERKEPPKIVGLNKIYKLITLFSYISILVLFFITPTISNSGAGLLLSPLLFILPAFVLGQIGILITFPLKNTNLEVLYLYLKYSQTGLGIMIIFITSFLLLFYLSM